MPPAKMNRGVVRDFESGLTARTIGYLLKELEYADISLSQIVVKRIPKITDNNQRYLWLLLSSLNMITCFGFLPPAHVHLG